MNRSSQKNKTGQQQTQTQTIHASTRTMGSRGMGACWLTKAHIIELVDA